jgi:UDPglucose 6-dehydrogenase
MVMGEIMQIGIVGQGYVGTAVKSIFEKHYKTNTFDLNGDCTCRDIEDLVAASDIIFVCVPTPMKKDGSCDTSIVEAVVKDIDEIVSFFTNKDHRIVAIKSTIPPGTTNRLNKKCKNISVIFNPEFLTEANFIDDFKNQNRIIIGGERPSTTKLRQVYSLAFPKAKIVKTGSITAEMVKYFTNTFLATKVSFANEMYQICGRLGIDYDKVVEYSTYDERLGKSHWAVPGPDGHYGFGGSCFPKDINALIHLGLELDMTPEVLMAAWETNLEVRPEEDWRELKGRAVVDE